MVKHSIAIIIPAFEPTEHLPALVKDLRSFLDNPIVIVNDGSDPALYRENFEKCASLPGVEILNLDKNTGKGNALKTAFSYCLKKKISGVVTADSDGQHLPEDVRKCVESLVENPGFLVLGCRRFHGENVPFKNRIGNLLTCFIFFLLTGKRISDTQTGLRGIPAEFLQRFSEIPGARFEYETNMLLQAEKWNLPILEIEISTVYDMAHPSTHFRPVRDSLMICKILLKSMF